MNESNEAIEIVLNSGEAYFTYDYGTVKEVRDAIHREDILKCWFMRVDGIRFEEDYWFNHDAIRVIRTNRS